MKIIFNIFLLLFIVKLSAQEKIRLSYNGFFQDRLENNISKLEFEITNLTKDTLYLSEENLQYKVMKNGKMLSEEKRKLSIGTPFVRPRIAQCPEEQRLKYLLATDFAKKLAHKNKIAKNDFDDAVQKIALDCIVVFPEERIYTVKIFYHSQFDKKCEVINEYVDRNVFTTFQNSSNEIVEIKR